MYNTFKIVYHKERENTLRIFESISAQRREKIIMQFAKLHLYWTKISPIV